MKILRYLAFVVLLVGTLWAAMTIWPSHSTVARTAGDAHDKGAVPPEPPLADLAVTDPEHRRTPVEESNTAFQLQILTPNGKQVKGRAYWTFLETKPWIGAPMEPAKGFVLPEKGSGQKEFEDTVEIPAPTGAALWLRVMGGEGDQTREAYWLLGARERKEVLRMAEGPGALHVFLLDSEKQHNLTNTEVRVFYTPFNQGQARRLLATARTDGRGYVHFGKLPLGRYDIVGPGAQLDDASPYRVSMVLGGPASYLEWPLVLVEKPSVSEVNLVVDSSLGLVDDVPPKLYAMRVGPGSPHFIPMQGSLRKGTQRFSMSLSDGEYEMRVLPEGAGTVGDGYCLVTVRNGKAEPQRFSVSARNHRVPVEFVGLGRNDFPFRAWFRPEKRELDERESIFFTGPFQWSLPTLEVHLPEGEGRWVLSGRYGNWIAKAPAYAAAGPMRVTLQKACKLEVRWFGQKALRTSRARLLIRTSHGEEIRSTSNQIVDDHHRSTPARIGAAVIPYGWAQISCVDSESGKSIWSRRVDAQKPWITLDVRD